MSGGFTLGRNYCNGTNIGADTANTRGTACTGGSGAYGSYVQLSASTPIDSSAMLVSVQTNGAANSSNQEQVKIAIGGAGSEVDIISDLVITQSASAYGTKTYFVPIPIPAGTRVAAAARGPSGTDTSYVSIDLFDSDYEASNAAAGADSIGFSGTTGTTITNGAANTKGSYAQLIASTAKDYFGFFVVFDFNNAGASTERYLIDIAIGGAGSEQIIVPNLAFSANDSNAYYMPVFFEIPIPAGTRIAARSQSAVGSNTIILSLRAFYQ